MNLENLKSVFTNSGCTEIYVKRLAPNDNSKNQVYLAGSFDVLNIFPLSDIQTVEAGDWKKERFKAKLRFSWIDDNGIKTPAPNAQLILYPKYPEVRFSGFLLGCKNGPTELMTSRLNDRFLFLSVTKTGEILGYVSSPSSTITHEFLSLKSMPSLGVFSIIEITSHQTNKAILLNELKRIHNLNWITSKRLDSKGSILNCKAPNCGGYTLEAELGITPNGYSEPDFMGWEIKQFGVKNFTSLSSSIITLMTPEPTDGLYKTMGTEYFIRTYGYPDKKGRADRMNFGGIHKAGTRHETTNLKLHLIGFDTENGKIRNVNGKIALIDQDENEAASWSFASLLLHWNRKHDKACYVPSISKVNGARKYMFSNSVILGTGTDFQLFLNQMSKGNIYYDPGIKLENISTAPKIKKRSQFRIKSKYLSNLYRKNELINVTE